jgi:hypothetical protein
MTNNDKDYIRSLVTVIGETTNDDLKEKLRENLRDKMLDLAYDYEIYEFLENGEIYNMYINWDAGCGASVVEASMNFEPIADYVIDEGIDINDFTIYRAVEIMTQQFGERDEYYDDLFDDDGDPVDAEHIIEVIEELEEKSDTGENYHKELYDYIQERIKNKKPKFDTIHDPAIHKAIKEMRDSIKKFTNMIALDYDMSRNEFVMRNVKEQGSGYRDNKYDEDFFRCMNTVWTTCDIYLK